MIKKVREKPAVTLKDLQDGPNTYNPKNTIPRNMDGAIFLNIFVYADTFFFHIYKYGVKGHDVYNDVFKRYMH